MLRCYKGRWPDEIVPVDEPAWLYYEVDVVADNIIRSLHIFQDGRIERNSVALEERNGDICPSLTDQPFLVHARDHLEEISPSEFASLWSRGIDKPFWFP
ncbi:hypothetical protein [Mesorhizobium sp. BE184]|uniref:hypothetical protein n=1 Tax=Mesorhizobium sp. BE184 TaxID=2817714 RepID=UPI00285ECDCA|nr:hypothetical protein [Mesorhizobium sp. BE184]MDR7033514.1 hypothetical protein [Mesorhizobium sp. BE184]